MGRIPPIVGDAAATVAFPAASEIAAVCVLPFSIAVMFAVRSLVIGPAVAVNVAAVLSDSTITEFGAVNAGALVTIVIGVRIGGPGRPDTPDTDTLSVTMAPPIFDTVTVHVALAPDPRLAGLHVNPLNTIEAASEIATVCVLPSSAAVTVAVWLPVIVPAVAVKVAAARPEATVTEAGTVNAAVLSDKETTAPPTGAGAANETVHVDDPPVLSDAGTQFSPLRVAGGAAAAVTIPATPFMGSEFPMAPAPRVFVTAIIVYATLETIVAVTTATTPFCRRVPFRPASTHI